MASDDEFIDLVMDEEPLRKAMLRYSTDILFLSLVISCISAALVYLALHYLFVRPMRRVTANMIAFRADPENSDRVIAPSARNDEIGTAERELATMQIELASMLHQKNRLASLGLAVAKINHDLRNLLASAQLFSERLAKIPDPGVQRFAPKLVHALERAIAFASRHCPTAACRSRRRSAGRSCSSRWSRRCTKRWGSAPMRRSAGSARSSAGSSSRPITTSCSASC